MKNSEFSTVFNARLKRKKDYKEMLSPEVFHIFWEKHTILGAMQFGNWC